MTSPIIQQHYPTTQQKYQATPTCQGLFQEAAKDPGNEILARLANIEAKLDAISEARTIQEFYSVEEFAKRVHRSKYCVRQWCNYQRVVCEKRDCGRGQSREWRIPHSSLLYFMSHGLLPDRRLQQSQK